MPEFMPTFPEFLVYLAIMVGVTYLLRLLPMLFIRKPIKNRFIRSLLYYTPYSVLAVMTVPAIFYLTENVITGIIATVFAVTLAYLGNSLITVAAGSAVVVLICELVIKWIG